jgi:hypothetical protein
MRQSCFAVGCLSAVLLSLALQADQEAQGERVAVRLRLGSPSRLENRLTGEVLDLRATPDYPGVRCLRKRVPQSAAEGATDTRFATATISCETRLQSVAGDVVLTQTVASKEPGVVDVGWGFGGVSSQDVQVIVPGYSGTAFGRNRGTPFRELGFSWPASWEAGLVLLQMEKGGFIIWGKDPDWRFKRFRLRHAKGEFSLLFETEAVAPFDAVTDLVSVPWHIDAYQGDWRQGASIYRQWLRDRLKPPTLGARSPRWVGEATAMVICGMDVETIRELAKQVVPQRTVLYVPGWRRDGYDKNYPDYTPLPEFVPFVQEAHRLGFRVMAHVNYFGCDPKHPLYQTFEPYQLRTAGSDKKEWWTWPRDLKEGEEPPIKFAYIHPGCRAWREELVRRFSKLVQETGVDALHLDQTLHITNHNRGRVDGMTVPEGNLALHRDLRDALPEVALSGEGLDEVTFVHEAFAQRHAPHAVNHTKKTWDYRFIRCAHPICSYLFSPHTTINGYLGMSNPNSGALWDAWVQSYELWGVIPTFARPSPKQLAAPEMRASLTLEELSLWTRHRLFPDFDDPGTTDTRLVWRGDQATAVVEHSPTGGSRVRFRTGGKDRTLYEYASGVRTLTTDSVLPNWLAYRDGTYLGLSPANTYLLVPDAPRPKGIHFRELPPALSIREARANAMMLTADLVSPDAGLVKDLVADIDEAETTIIGPGGPLPLADGASFQPERISDEWGVHPAIFAHPPWKNRRPDTQLPDTTCGTFRVRLPKTETCAFTVGLALRGQAESKSDGVTFRVLVNGKTLLDRHYGNAKWEHHDIDLSAYRGQEIQLALCTSPGPDNNLQFDWALWGDPAIRATAEPARLPVELSSPTPIRTALDGQGVVPLTPLSQENGQYQYRCAPLLPGPVTALLQEATPVRLPCELAELPFIVSVLDATGSPSRSAPAFARVHPGKAASLGVERTGLHAHPPGSGQTVADFTLRLPAEGKPRLQFAVGIRDGSRSSGCRFLVRANGRTVWQTLVNKVDGWHEAAVDLSPYAGQPLVLSLAVDPAGPYNYDWAFWAEPRIVDASP